MKLFKRLSKEERKRRRDEKELEEFNERQEKYDDALRDATQKNTFKTLMSRLKFETYTKRLVAVIIVVCLIDLQLTYVLAFMDKIQIAESLSIQICITILGTAFGYMAKAYFETKAEKSSKEYHDKHKSNNDFVSNIHDGLNNIGIDIPDIRGHETEHRNHTEDHSDNTLHPPDPNGGACG